MSTTGMLTACVQCHASGVGRLQMTYINGRGPFCAACCARGIRLGWTRIESVKSETDAEGE